ncbi:hypothetical protein DFA_03238 [Cavenderia fasciculata]|uniref:F-box domain-containing protein n=1 Tax=Cavenderia fasciculata TaxID=261658 RepID=F4PH08_CACFS|nr:uncharacterized protein DFA_03238 [Cavenderia fasciculata]EGG24992.1 hypothetical protein DFA_03238 [Cavenderia fasciculata]|eukprot:XP_004362843.1 hypothetical protein DFA_03238 [Cavenderia fasciculata]
MSNNNSSSNTTTANSTNKKSLLDTVVSSVMVNHKRTPSENVYPTNPNIPLTRELSNPLSFSTSAMQNNPLPSSPLKNGISSSPTSSSSIPIIVSTAAVNVNNASSSPSHSNIINNNSHSGHSSSNSSPSTSVSGGSTITSLSQHPHAVLLGSGPTSTTTTTTTPVTTPTTHSTKTTPATHDDDDEEEESSSEEEYEDDGSILSLQSMAIGLDNDTGAIDDDLCMSLSDLGDNIIVRISGHLHADDVCSLIRASKHFQGLLALNQPLWRDLNNYYVRTMNSDPYDVNLWDEELYQQQQQQQQQQAAAMASATVKEKGRSITFSSKDAKKSILDINATVGKKSAKSERILSRFCLLPAAAEADHRLLVEAAVYLHRPPKTSSRAATVLTSWC